MDTLLYSYHIPILHNFRTYKSFSVMLSTLAPRINFANKVRNTKLPKTKALMPLFEVISNSIHAIQEAKQKTGMTGNGKIKIRVIRNGSGEVLNELGKIDTYPVKSFEVEDDGIGLDDENLNYFIESDTDHKIELGGRGVGRFVCLKAFRSMVVDSCFQSTSGYTVREFEFKPSKEVFHDFRQFDAPAYRRTGTKVTLSQYQDEFVKYVPRVLSELAKAIVLHFQLYFLKRDAPQMSIENQNSENIDLQTFYDINFKKFVKEASFGINEHDFRLYLTKLYNAQSHKIHYCAHNRTVKDEPLHNRIVDLGKFPISDDTGTFYYQAFVVGKLLDENLDTERVNFTFPAEEEDDVLLEEVTVSKIRNEAIKTVENLLIEYLNELRDKKVAAYYPIIENQLPQYRTVLTHRLDQIKHLQPNLNTQKLDLALYKIENEWKEEVKSEGINLLLEQKDIQNLDIYKERYAKFLSEFNEVGKVDLARYIVHRKAVIELLESLLGQTEDKKFSDEDVLHSLFFPIRSTSDDVPHDKQNLWLIDERMTYHSFLASDKRFDKIEQVDVTNSNRTDLLIYNNAFAFAEDGNAPFSAITIVEFKKPQRNDFQDYDPKKNPLDQVELYITDLLEGKVTDRRGRQIRLSQSTPFYAYIVCDITDTLVKILKKREFVQTPDGLGWFRFKGLYYSAYIEVLPFEKVLSDAKKRNRILFDKLGIS